MKRFHVHISVKHFLESTAFYSSLFGTKPTFEKSDYAKWILQDLNVNFAISQAKHPDEVGISHIGVQFDSQVELSKEINKRRATIALESIEQTDALCCYSQSNKQWILDPQNIAWEFFYSAKQLHAYGNKNTKNELDVMHKQSKDY